MKNISVVISLCLISVSLSLLTLDTNNPFRLTPAFLNISTIVMENLTDSFLIGFSDGQARRYSSDFSSYTSLPAPEPVDQFSPLSLTLANVTLPNGRYWSMDAAMTVTLSNSFKTIRVYSSPDYI
jgi:hypothetical protein